MNNCENVKDYLNKTKQKNYLHLDFPISKGEQKKLIDNLDKEIFHHRYLPFIRTNIVFLKYSGITKEVKPKIRKLTLPSHHDAVMYQYFGYQLSRRYEKRVKNTVIDNAAVAYRLDKHVSNITVAKEIVDFVTDHNECWIIKGDFKSFFDMLDHKVLIKSLLDLLGKDYDISYKKMIRSLTKYKYITRDTLENQLRNLKINKPYRRASGKAYTKNLRQLGHFIKNRGIRLSSPNRVGIPQGTAVSAVLANIYMYNFDRWLSANVKKYNGIYRRYSDDFIVVVPMSIAKQKYITSLKDKIIDYSKKKIHLKIERHKTQLLFYSKKDREILKFTGNAYNKSQLVYLGFAFDGISVSLRSKSAYKFTYRSKRAINRYISVMNNRKRYYNSEGLSRLTMKYNSKGKREYRWLNNTEKFRKRKFYVKAVAMKTTKVHSYHKNIVKRFLAIKNVIPRSSMLSYANKAQKLFQYRSHGKYRVVIRRQVQRQIIRNQRIVGITLH